jgi:hypothetical protein
MLAACQTLGDEQKTLFEQLLSTGSVDWQRLVHLSTVHGTYPLLCRHLNAFPEFVPASILASLQKAADANARKNVCFMAELIKLKALFAAKQIQFITYKGPSLAFAAYGDLSSREFVDLDIVVDHTQLPLVQNTLFEAGYGAEPAKHNLSKDFMASDLFRKLEFEQTFSRRPNVAAVATSFVDVHWKVAPQHVVDLRFEELMKNSVEIDLCERKFRTFVPELLLVLLCCHATKHQWLLLKWLVDVAAVVQRNRQLDWHKVYEIAQRFGVCAKVDLALILCAELPGYRHDLPADIANRLNSQLKRFAPIKRQTLQSWFNPGSEKSNHRLHWRYELATFDTYQQRASFMLHELFDPGLPTYLRSPLPAALYPLYHVIHPLVTMQDFLGARLQAFASKTCASRSGPFRTRATSSVLQNSVS